MVVLITIEEAKLFLRLDSNNEDTLIESLILTSQSICEDILRVKIIELEVIPETLKIAILYGTTYLYENRETANHSDLIKTLTSLLFGIRREMF